MMEQQRLEEEKQRAEALRALGRAARLEREKAEQARLEQEKAQAQGGQEAQKAAPMGAEEKLIDYVKQLQDMQLAFAKWATSAAEQQQDLQKFVVSRSSGSRVDVPYPKFGGTADEDVAPFLFSMGNTLTARQISDPKVKVAAAIANLSGPALAWAAAIQGSTSPFNSWEDFKARLEAYFTRGDLQYHLRDQLHDLRQIDTVESYASAFRSLVARVKDMTEFDKVILFTRGLKAEIAPAVREKMPKTLDEAIGAANIHEGARRVVSQAIEADAWRVRARQPPPRAGGRPQRLDPAEFARRRQEGLCFQCGRPGHIKADCEAREA